MIMLIYEKYVHVFKVHNIYYILVCRIVQKNYYNIVNNLSDYNHNSIINNKIDLNNIGRYLIF